MSNSQPQGYTNFNLSWYQKINSNISRVRNTLSPGNLGSLTTGHNIKISPNSHHFLEKLSPFQRVLISRKIAALSATPRPNDAAKQKNSNEIYCVTEFNTGFSISYKIHSTVIYVLEVLPNPKLKGRGRELPAIYYIKRLNNNEWALNREPVSRVRTKHAAINGQSNVLERAYDLMGKHINFSFKNENVKEFSLFHNPSDGGFWDTYESSLDKKQQTTAVSKQFAQVLGDIQNQETPVKWLAHSQGGLIFSEASRYHWEEHHSELSFNSVQFNAGANNEQKTKNILKNVNIKLLGFNNHPFDPVPNIVGGNAKDWVSKLGAFVGFAFVFTDNAEKSPHTLPYSGNSLVVNKVYEIKKKSALAVQALVNSIPK